MADDKPISLLEASSKKNSRKIPELLTDNSSITSANIVGQDLDFYNTASRKYGQFNPLEYSPQELLAQEQGIGDKWANALIKTAGKVGTSFVNTTVGLLSSLGSGAYGALDNNPNTTFLTGFWDDPVGRAMQDTDDWFEKQLPNYRTKESQDNNVLFAPRSVFSSKYYSVCLDVKWKNLYECNCYPKYLKIHC
jgi:hypothetical protein